MQTLH